MIKIEVDAYNCCRTNCVFHRECACHHSAGDYRMEDGFRPEIFVETDTNEFFCKTATEEIAHDDDDPRTHYSNFPKNHYLLESGFEPITYTPN